MKRTQQIIIFILCIGFLLAFMVPVSANPSPRTRSITLLLEKNGTPDNEIMNFSLNCYGYFQNPTDQKKYLREITTEDPNPPSLIFSLSDNCPAYGCSYFLTTKSPPEKYWEPENSMLCELNGTKHDFSFSIWNMSDSGILCNIRSAQWNIEKTAGRVTRYYNYTPEYFRCMERIKIEKEQCREYLGKNFSGMNDSPSAYTLCLQEISHKELACDSNLMEINISLTDPAEYHCIFRFDPSSATPSDENITFGTRAVATAEYSSPVTSLYCSILPFFGAEC